MVLQVKPIQPSDVELEGLVARVFFKALDLLGGLNQLAEFRTLTWLPSLARSAFVIVLKEEFMKTEEEIAQKVGLTKNTVRNILRADPNLAMEKIKKLEELSKEELKDLKVHTAGGIAKLAYKFVKEGNDAQTLIRYISSAAEDVARALDIPWAYLVLKNIKGVDYPINSSEELKDRLKELSIKGLPAEEVIEHLHYPIETPAKLLHEIKEYLSMKGL